MQHRKVSGNENKLKLFPQNLPGGSTAEHSKLLARPGLSRVTSPARTFGWWASSSSPLANPYTDGNHWLKPRFPDSSPHPSKEPSHFVIPLEPSSTHFKLPTLFSKPSWATPWLLPTKEIFQQKSHYLSIRSQISLSKCVCLRRGPSALADLTGDLCCQIPREAAAFLRSMRGASLIPAFPRAAKKKYKKKINTSKSTDRSFVSELPVIVQPDVSRV